MKESAKKLVHSIDDEPSRSSRKRGVGLGGEEATGGGSRGQRGLGGEEAMGGGIRGRRGRRSVSRDSFVETLVVVDTQMLHYHGRERLESYVLTIMNIVSLDTD